ncbi:MAG: Mur ligase family protein, partial [Myxococcota bacterium]|nr:Mur ligase family protein [Myxococcota bacterium]
MIDHPILSRLARFGIQLGLDRTRGFLAYLGHPHRAVPVVHVAGTNGKGSVARMVAEVLATSGLRVGEYSSPHLQRINERIRVAGEEISDEALSALLEEVDEARRRWIRGVLGGTVSGEEERALTYFEMMTVAAFVHYARSEIDVLVAEVGLGGRLDATSVVEPVVTAVTSVGLDHTDRLGSDLASIASEKAGILRDGVPMVVGRLPAEALGVVRALAQERGSPLYPSGSSFRVQGGTDSFSWTGLEGPLADTQLRGLSLGMPGAHQVENAGVAISLLQLLPPELRPVESSIREGLARARAPGRLEWLGPDLLVDCAHNVDGA